MWEIGVPSHEVIQRENILSHKSIEHVLPTKQPPYPILCKGTLICTATTTKHRNLPPQVEKVLKEIDDVFFVEDPTRLQPYVATQNWKAH